MDLRFVRSYNQGFMDRGWTFGLAGVPMRVLNPGGPPPDDCCDWPQLVGVGSTLRMTPRNTIVNDTEFVAADFSQYDAVTRTLALPNGWVATYEAGDFLPGGAMLVEVHDPYGNTITPEWEIGATRPFRLLSVTQTVGTSNRTVAFTYDAASNLMPKTMTFGSRVWVYEYDHEVPSRGAWYLTRVNPPEGSPWVYAYADGNGYDGWLQLTTPNGGTVHYDFEDQALPASSGVSASVVRSRVTGGPDVVPGTWSFAYEELSTEPAMLGTVTYPDGRVLEFLQDPVLDANPISAHWVPRRKVLRDDSGGEVRRVDFTYQSLGVTSMHAIPVMKSRVISQSGESYTVEHFYAATDFGDLHRPWKTEETGDMARTTTRAFDYDFSIHVMRTKSETVTVGAESATISRVRRRDRIHDRGNAIRHPYSLHSRWLREHRDEQGWA